MAQAPKATAPAAPEAGFTTAAADRQFKGSIAIRKRVPFWMAFTGPSSSGKTNSALRIGTGMVRVLGGKLGFVDTENDRGLHYAPPEGEKAIPPNTFDFFHVPLSPPFGSLHYLAAVRYCIANGCTAVVIDSLSHEHEGIGGLLEQHEDEIDRLVAATGGRASREDMSMLAWKNPKMARRRMKDELMQLGVVLLPCFRAKTKIDMTKGKKQDRSVKGPLVPISGEDLIFEMTVQALLRAKSEGTPDWAPKHPIEQEMSVKLPGQFRELFSRSRQLDEEMGEGLAKWALGGEKPKASAAANQGTTGERAAVIKELGKLRQALDWDVEKSKAWRGDVLGESDPNKLTMRQLEDARALLDLLQSAGQEAYDAEVLNLIDLGRLPKTSEVQP